MNNNFFSFVLIPIIVLTAMAVARYVRHKRAKPEQNEGVQRAGKFDIFLKRLITGVAIFSGFFTLLGVVMGEIEMTIVFLVMTLIFTGIVFLLRREYNMSYQENDEFFLLEVRGEEYKVFYKDIVDWQPSFNEIEVLDETRADGKYIRVNIAIFKPEILLQKIVEMTFAGKFSYFEPGVLQGDPMRKDEIVNYLMDNNYSYLVDDYVEK
jgi:hypothetical protein